MHTEDKADILPASCLCKHNAFVRVNINFANSRFSV